MHDFLLAKEIIEELKRVADDKGATKITEVWLEVGNIAIGHDGLPEHAEDVSVENLEFALKSIAKSTVADGAAFHIEKIEGDEWKITEVDGE